MNKGDYLYCKEHLIYTDTWADSADTMKCTKCSFKVDLHWGRRSYHLFLDDDFIKLKKFDLLYRNLESVTIPSRFSRMNFGYIISHIDLLKYIKEVTLTDCDKN